MIVTPHNPLATQPARPDLPNVATRILVGLFIISAATIVLSTTTAMVRAIYVLTLLWALLTGGLHLWRLVRRSPRVRAPIGIVLLALIAWALFASRPVNPQELRTTYLTRLHWFSGAYYIWGGETHVGIDCSGLARTALWESMLTVGVQRANPRLLGPRFWSFWWHDVSAKDLLAGTYGYTRVIGHTLKLAGADVSALLPGDMAVTDNGIHVLIYLGKGEWIEANPEDGHVVINRADATSTRAYFSTPVTFVRWTMLE